jgi:hypothetical protein
MMSQQLLQSLNQRRSNRQASLKNINSFLQAIHQVTLVRTMSQKQLKDLNLERSNRQTSIKKINKFFQKMLHPKIRRKKAVLNLVKEIYQRPKAIQAPKRTHIIVANSVV